MPQIIKKDDGTEETVYTQAETDEIATKKAEDERVRIEAESEASKAELQGKLEETQEALEKEKLKEKNFNQMRKGEDKNLGNQEQLQKSIQTLQDQINQISAQPIALAKKSYIEKHIGTIKEDVDKFNYYYQKVGKDAKTEEEVSAALLEALILTTGGKVGGGNGRDHKAISTGADNSGGGNGSGEESEASKEFAKNLGVSEDAKKKYGGKVKVDLF